MGYERYSRGSNQGGYYNRPEDPDYARDYNSGRDYSYSSARQYQAAGDLGRDDDRGGYDRDTGRDGYGTSGYGSYGERGSYGDRDYGPREYGYGRYAQRDRFQGNAGRDYGAGYDNRSSGYYGGGDTGRTYGRDLSGDRGSRDYGRQPQGYDYRERGFLDRAGDEVRSWFGDAEAERRREFDARQDARNDYGRDGDYHSWRRGQIDALDRDYHEYRQENRTKFENDFGNWRSERQTQRGSLSKVTEHMDVVGSDGAHVGTVDKVRGDRIILTKSDSDAGGRHHSIPSRWLKSVDDKVTLSKTAEEAHAHWRDEERNQAMFGESGDRDQNRSGTDIGASHNLNRSFSGTY